MCMLLLCFFFFNQKTAYELRISDWSSDVCSSDLTIIGMARALGETAPLLLVGMRAFIGDVPGGICSPSTVLPMQIFLWSDEVDRGFVEKTSAAIIVLLVVLLSMNAFAIYLRNKFEKRW